MQIQILGLREYTDRKSGKIKKADRFFEKGWRLNNIQEVFGDKGRELLQSIPENERYNIYYTAANCFESAKREMKEMHIIPFDIDGIDNSIGTYKDNCLAIGKAVAEVVKCDVAKLGILFSGNGVQVIVNISQPITDKHYFDQYKKHYSVICAMIEAKLKDRNITFDAVDPTVFDDARILRFPNTMNRKKDKIDRMAEVLQGDIQPVDWDIVTISGVTETAEVLTDAVLKSYPTPDAEAVLDECLFLQHCKNKPALVKEYEWYAMVSITSRLPDGEAITHSLSEGHPGYSSFETDAKIKQALASAGPRTCSNIATMFDGCKDCKHWGKHKSPIQIKGDDYIASKDFGFREKHTDKNGNLKAGKPHYDDIVKQFSLDFNYRIMADNQDVYIFNGKYWREMPMPKVKEWIAGILKPSGSRMEVDEALGRIRHKNVVDRTEFTTTAQGLLNFTNCVYDIMADRVLPHGPEYGFFNIIPYDYDAQATCPLWDKFMLTIMNGKQELVSALMQYAGYCLAYDSYWIHKCLLLYGSGSNGKSVFAETLEHVFGKDNTSSIGLREILGSQTTRMQMLNKFFNYSDESSRDVFKDTAMFKTLTQGGTMTVKKLYSQEYTVANKTKLIISCNELPDSLDATDGFFRRFLIIPFDYKVEPGDPDYIPDLKEQLWATELPGICNKIIAAYRELKNKKMLDTPAESALLLKQYRKDNDSVATFVEDCVEVTNNEEDKVLSTEIYEKYVLYTETMGTWKLPAYKFFRRLNREIKGEAQTIRKGDIMGRGRKGIKLRSSW